MAQRKLIISGSAFEVQIGYSRSVVSNKWVFVSGCTGYDYAAGKISSDVAEQAEQSFCNVNRALLDSGATMQDIVRVRYILPDRGLFPKTWPVLQKWLGKVKPAATMMVAGLMEEAMLFEVEVTARISDVGNAAVVEVDASDVVEKTGALPVGI